MTLPDHATCTIAIIGLGYVGLPLTVEFAKANICLRTGLKLNRKVIGFDISSVRLDELRAGIDNTNEIRASDLPLLPNINFTNDISMLSQADIYIVTVPTPIDKAKRPNLVPLETASSSVGSAIRMRTSTVNPIIIYESTVFPGATEDVCVPILEKESGLRFNKDFFCGYSPERVNPGDRSRTLTDITKVTSGSTIMVANWIDKFYGSIIKAGTHQASSIQVAEAAKVIENTQRDLNIALVNELSIVFRKMNIDTLDVLEAAGSKWNFLPFRPGLVGGHCIGVDPYYLTHKAEEIGYHPQLILAGRRINDGMAYWHADEIIMQLCKLRIAIFDANILILGITFKENCPDIRNTKVLDLIQRLSSYGATIKVVDPYIDSSEALSQASIEITKDIPTNQSYDAIVLAVPHREFSSLTSDKWGSLLNSNGLIFDLKGIVPRELNPFRP